ncbi:MAG: hypothetical protein JW963_12665 [Anaerolineales bacterium]|nr:hypothetical protein [Anaerolineales bacterium]
MPLSTRRQLLSAYNQMRDMVGRSQLLLGRDLTVTGTPRMALEQWKFALRDVPEPQRGQVLVAAIHKWRWIAWAIFSGCYLLRMGYRPTIVYSGAHIAKWYGTGRNNFWAAAQALPYFNWIDLDPLMAPADGPTDYDDFARDAAHTVVAYDLEVEEYEPGQAPGEYEKALAVAEPMLRRYAVAIEQVLEQHPTQRLICPSGLIDESLAIYEVARRMGHETVYVEDWALRPGHNIWNLNRPALEYDIEGWLRSLGEWGDEFERDARDYMAFREGNKIEREGWLDNFHQVQQATKDVPLPPELELFLQREGSLVLLGTNVVGDSATLRRKTIFRSQQAWLEQTIAFFKQQPEMNLVVRAHPDETWARARLRLGNLAREFAADAPNIFVVNSHEKVNTYQLVDRCDVGLAWVSNIGLDMALRGKPVVMGAKPQYAGLGVVHEPATRDEYFALITQLAANPVGPDEAAMQRGKAFHHIVFKLFSLEADDRRYKAASYRLGDQYDRADQQKFYQILAGELNNYGQPPDEAGAL